LTRAGADKLRERLAAACARHLGGSGAIEDLRRLSGGASQETWSFDLVTPGAARLALILRRNARSEFQNIPATTEFALLEAAQTGGVPVPSARYLLDEGDGLGEGYVMERIEGETIARKI
jgi:aminoglycoside phosphotransferase (APT) family kinase protein